MTELKLQQSLLDGRYEILDCLGRGSYAEIYVARDLSAMEGEPKTVVIKALNILLQGVPDRDLERTLIENFQNEAVALDRVRHPNIINRLGHGTAIDLSGTAFHYIVLEYMAGGDLGARCRHQPFLLDRALFYLKQVCSGLAHAHDCGVIHRDIKPQNLLLTADGQIVKIADFGVAKLEATEGAITRVGTNIYAPPEHNPLVQTGQLDASAIEDGQHLTPAADIYSLAKTTYTLLAGEPPRRFSHRQITELPESISGKTWAADVLRVLRRATEEKPENRYQTVQEFWEELSDASLPPTKPLKPQDVGEARVRPSSQLTKVAAVVEVPPRPRFDSRDVIDQSQAQGNGTRPRIVVPVRKPELNYTNQAQHQQPVIQVMPQPNVAANVNYVALPDDRRGRRTLRIFVALLIILAFAGILLATHYYVSRKRAAQASAVTPSGNTSSPFVGREVNVTTQANMRRDPSMSSPTLRTVDKGTRVRILSVNDNNTWFEVEILDSNGSSDNTNQITHGWMGRKVLDVD
ncbi:MAG TPA: protein kinase [Pyrinomonadaceae bacterium]|nr:protein kinase [Pyrinomonadaceae bacterium]